jgi:hypothetical protein
MQTCRNGLRVAQSTLRKAKVVWLNKIKIASSFHEGFGFGCKAEAN